MMASAHHPRAIQTCETPTAASPPAFPLPFPLPFRFVVLRLSAAQQRQQQQQQRRAPPHRRAPPRCGSHWLRAAVVPGRIMGRRPHPGVCTAGPGRTPRLRPRTQHSTRNACGAAVAASPRAPQQEGSVGPTANASRRNTQSDDETTASSANTTGRRRHCPPAVTPDQKLVSRNVFVVRKKTKRDDSSLAAGAGRPPPPAPSRRLPRVPEETR